MNRSQRRRAAILETKVMTADELKKLRGGGHGICAWAGCKAVFRGDLPPSWVYLMAYWRRQPSSTLDFGPETKWYRDGVLCPEHQAALERLLTPLSRPDPRLLDEAPSGQA